MCMLDGPSPAGSREYHLQVRSRSFAHRITIFPLSVRFELAAVHDAIYKKLGE